MEDLKELDNLFNEVKDEPAEEDYPKLPDGTYGGKVDNAEYKLSAKGNPMIVIVYEIMEGEYKGFKHYQFNMLTGKTNEFTAKNLKALATLMKKFGVATDNGLNGVVDQLPTILNREVKLTLTTTVSKAGNEFTHTSVDI